MLSNYWRIKYVYMCANKWVWSTLLIDHNLKSIKAVPNSISFLNFQTKTVAHPTFQKVQTVTHHVEQPAVVAHTPVFHHAPALGHALAAPVAHQPYALPEGHVYAPHVAPAHAAAAWGYHH